MIVDQLAHAALYERMTRHMHHAWTFLRRADLNTLAKGRHEIAGEDAFAMVHEYDTRPVDQATWEGHRKYIDVQYILSGVEGITCNDIGQMSATQDYDANRDFQPFTGQGDLLTIRAGFFAIFFPHDIHQPAVAIGQPGPVRKVVVKVRVDGR